MTGPVDEFGDSDNGACNKCGEASVSVFFPAARINLQFFISSAVYYSV